MGKIKNLLKNNRIFYKVYQKVFNTIFVVIKLIVKVDENVILFNSFGGKKYDDSPRVIYEYMITQNKYKKYKIYWAFEEPEKFEIDNVEKIKTDTFKYFYIALKAKYWITNSAIERGLKFKNKKTVYINTWHGTALKKMGIDAPNSAFKFETSKYDVMYAQSNYDIDVFSKAFELPKEIFALVGLPRNDELAVINNEEIQKIKEKLKIPKDKKIILYAPTFREYKRDKNGCIIAPPINLEKWKKYLSKEYIVLFRAHYEVNKVLGIKSDEFIYDVSAYKNLNELMKISDMLISDYSSIMFDYSILERPIFSYAYDYEEYNEKRGMYFNINDKIPGNCIKEEEDLLNRISEINYENEKKKTIKFKNEYIEAYGEARKYIDNIIK